ncbi:hypothetical protein E2C01_099691 [Portunus trituberculatus]|uniref:Uncharacterized protein n=1 Tax=Portunus trituberculatus TaxID=210409 RepID=A0A5B7K658_PORTR|nr:hypothetical protein [Portunus trituberculatus]
MHISRQLYMHATNLPLLSGASPRHATPKRTSPARTAPSPLSFTRAPPSQPAHLQTLKRWGAAPQYR